MNDKVCINCKFGKPLANKTGFGEPYVWCKKHREEYSTTSYCKSWEKGNEMLHE